jgi:UDP-GlcNAc:undecaprenyl-phosphate GlcNAc-1-phosphate transferase
VLDRPDARKVHAVATPKGGGVGIVAAFLIGIACLYAFASFSRLANGYFIGVIAASAAIALVAFLDDLRDWPFAVKLGAQILAASAALGTGLFVSVYRIPYFGGVRIGSWGLLPSLFWILFTTNAMNFIDGLDGLAGGVVLIACAFLAVIGAAQGGWFLYFAALLLAAGVVGFLPFNFPRARIFMGDVGSQFCGFVLAVLGVLAAGAGGRLGGQPGDGTISVLLVPMLLFGVLFDVVVTLARRLLAGEVLTQAHRSHLYQIAERCGVPAEAVTLVHWAMTAWGGVIFIAAGGLDGPWKAALPIAVIPPQIAWLAFVVGRARKAGLERW